MFIDLQNDRTVTNGEAITRPKVGQKTGVVDGKAILGTRTLIRTQQNMGIGNEVNRLRKLADPYLWTGQVGQDPNRSVEAFRHGPYPMEDFEAVIDGSVGEIYAGNIHARFDHVFEYSIAR